MMKFKILLLIGLLIPSLAQTSDLAKEQRWKEQVVADLFDGEAISLNDGENDFLALVTTADTASPNAVVVLHGVGAHPDWPQVVNPLRVGLAELGWTTLSIQLPVLANDAEPELYDALIGEAGPRIAAAIDHLRGEGAEAIYIVAHSLGSRMASAYLDGDNHGLAGFVGVGMSHNTVEYLDTIELPVLDLYGSEDLQSVQASASDRADAASGNPAYVQQEIEGADHFFNDQDDVLLMAVSEWLSSIQ